MKNTVLILLVMAAMALAGCTIVTSNSNTEISGTQVSPDTLNQLEEGKTTKQWVVATLGQPNSSSKVDESTEILKYKYTRTTKNQSGLLFVLSTDNRKEEKTTDYFEFKNDVLQRHWRAHE